MDPASHKLSPSSGPALGRGGPDDDLTGRTLGDFHVLRRLGQGGMGQVYLAEQLSLKRKVALKILKAELASNPVSLQRFKAEAEAVARFTHANIVQVYATGEHGGLYYMALEYVEGRTLREYVEKKGPLQLLGCLSIMRQVAAALQRAGEMGIIHRDIKPENILLTRKGEAKVADFGLSRCFADNAPTLNLTQTGVAMGTPLYMSPEQVEGKPVDPRTDIYSFGVTCYYMLAGCPPYKGQTGFEVALKHIQGGAQPLAEIRPDLPPALTAMVHKMMARLPEDRYQTAREIIKGVIQVRDSLAGVTPTRNSQFLATGPVAAPAAAPARPAAVPARPRKLRVWLAVGSVLLALAGGTVAGWLTSPPPAPSETVEDEPARAESFFFTRKEREKYLAAALKRYANPGEDQDRIRWGLKYGIELGLLYLEGRRLDEAERLFQQFDQPGKGKAYHKLGQLGRALVLAFRNRAEESVKLFLTLSPRYLKWEPATLSEREEYWYYQVFRSDPHLRRVIAFALDQNALNLGKDAKTFPWGRLNFLRWP
jgi:serine/threonine-protein kinase